MKKIFNFSCIEDMRQHWSAGAFFKTVVLFGTGTDVGKTFAASMLAEERECQWYWKPLQTGGFGALDAKRVSQKAHSNLVCEVGRVGDPPLSPHLIDWAWSYDSFMSYVCRKTHFLTQKGWGVIETAGGALTPLPDGSPQSSFYRFISKTAILVVSAELGGISQGRVLLKYLRQEGWEIPCILLMNCQNGNYETFREEEEGVFLIEEKEKWILRLKEYLRYSQNRVKWGDQRGVWWPLTQHATLDQFFWVEKAYGPWLWTLVVSPAGVKPRLLYDSTLSWWSIASGHGEPSVAEAASSYLFQMGHVLHPGFLTHPLRSAVEMLLNSVGHGWAHSCFFANDGASALEVALKLGVCWASKKGLNPQKILGLKGSYHGDTRGASDVSSVDEFWVHDIWRVPRGVWLEAPEIVYRKGEWYVEGRSYKTLEDCTGDEGRLKQWGEVLSVHADVMDEEIGMVLIEPILHGASGFRFIDPLFQKALVRLARQKGWVVIYDEILTGGGRLGCWDGRTVLGEDPDIACYGKWITGGLPVSVTLAREEVFQLFLGHSKRDSFLHSHTFAGNPPALAALVANMVWLSQYVRSSAFVVWRPFVWDFVKRVERFCSRILVIGTLLVLDFSDDHSYFASSHTFIMQLAEDYGFHIRLIGSVLYVQKNFDLSEENERYLLDQLEKLLERMSNL